MHEGRSAELTDMASNTVEPVRRQARTRWPHSADKLGVPRPSSRTCHDLMQLLKSQSPIHSRCPGAPAASWPRICFQLASVRRALLFQILTRICGAGRAQPNPRLMLRLLWIRRAAARQPLMLRPSSAIRQVLTYLDSYVKAPPRADHPLIAYFCAE